MKFTTTGTKDPLRSLTPRTRWLTTKVVWVTHLELLSRETNRQSTNTPGRNISMSFILLTMLLTTTLSIYLLCTAEFMKLSNPLISYLTYRTGQLLIVKAVLKIIHRSRKNTGKVV